MRRMSSSSSKSKGTHHKEIELFLNEFCASPVHQSLNPAFGAQKYLALKDAPGPRSLPLRRQNLENNIAKSEYFAGEKSDGERRFLFSPGDGQCFLIDVRGGKIERFPHIGERLGRGVTILDGELVENLISTPSTLTFLIFDAVRLEGEDIGAVQDFSARLSAANTFLSARGLLGNVAGLDLQVKGFVPANQVNELFACFKPIPGHIDLNFGAMWFERGIRLSRNDGIVFVPRNRPYYAHNCLKWKPPGCVTVDFAVDSRELEHAFRSSSDEPTVSLALSLGHQRIRVAELRIRKIADAHLLKDSRSRDEIIMECGFRSCGAVSGWEIIRLRSDKRKPNSASTAWRNMEVVTEALLADELTIFAAAHAASHFVPSLST